MSLTIQTSFQNIDQHAVHAAANGKKANGAAEGRKNMFVGDTLMAEQNPIEVRRKLAQKRALKVVGDAYANDRSVESHIDERLSHYDRMSKMRDAASSELKDINARQKALQEEYHVADDSKEQKDLELLKREQDMRNNVLGDSLTMEEIRRLDEIHKEPLTEYQSRSLELNNMAGKAKEDMADAKREMNAATAAIKSINLERLKADPMRDAQQTAEEIMETASKEIQGMMMDEVKDGIDEKTEEMKEEAKEKAEEKKEKDEIVEERQEAREIEQSRIEGTKEAIDEIRAKQKKGDDPEIAIDELLKLASPTDTAKAVSDSLNEIKNSMKLLEADLKGTTVDEEI